MPRNIWIIVAVLLSVAASAADPPKTYPSRRFVVEFIATETGAQQKFQAAIGYEGHLELIEAITPFKKELSAASVTIMFEARDPKGTVLAQLYGEQRGSLTLFGSVTGRSGKITDEPWHDCVTLSFGPF